MGNTLSRAIVRTTNGIFLWRRRNGGSLPQNTNVSDSIHLIIADPDKKGRYRSLDGRYKIYKVYEGTRTTGGFAIPTGTQSNIYGSFVTKTDLNAVDKPFNNKICKACLRVLKSQIEKAEFPASELKELEELEELNQPASAQAPSPAEKKTVEKTAQKKTAAQIYKNRSVAMTLMWAKRKARAAGKTTASKKTQVTPSPSPKDTTPATVEAIDLISPEAIKAGARKYLIGVRDEIDRIVSNL